MVYLEALVLASIALYLLYRWSVSTHHILTERGIPHKKPLPFIGNIDFNLLRGKKSLVQGTLEQYQLFKDEKISGIYSFRDISLVIRDPELLKAVTIKDFDSFPNHNTKIIDQTDSIFSKSLFVLTDRKWKEMRNTLSPAFTGSKMRQMFELVNECSAEGIKYIEEQAKTSSKDGLEIDLKDFFTRFTNDFIASAAFGIKVNSFKDKENQFLTIGKSLTAFNGWAIIKFLLLISVPKVMKTLRISFIDESKLKYFKSLVFDAIRYREKHSIIRPDMIHLLMEAKRLNQDRTTEEAEGHADFNDDDTLLAQCLVFFTAGFETVATCLCYTLQELIVNPEIQERLYQEILTTEEELDGKPLSYDALGKMKYMDMVISESLRKWPPAVMTDRMCSADYELKDSDGNVLTVIKKGELIAIPILGLHYDERNFAEPHKFDPERFSDENKKNIAPLTYIPFGVGPRSCIANRLALMEVKSVIYHILLNFTLQPTEKTMKDVFTELKGLQLAPVGRFWAKFVPRSTNTSN